MTLLELVEKHFNKDRKATAKAGGLTVANLNIKISKGAEVVEMANGNFIIKRNDITEFEIK
jgi:hypothetical protein